MLIVFLGGGDQKVDGRNCYVWPGIPPTDDVVRRVGNEAFESLRIQVEGLELPSDRINTYTTHELSGSYDGHTIIVATPRIRVEQEEALEIVLRRLYTFMQRLFFHIVHGDATGDYQLADPDTTSGR